MRRPNVSQTDPLLGRASLALFKVQGQGSRSRLALSKVQGSRFKVQGQVSRSRFKVKVQGSRSRFKVQGQSSRSKPRLKHLVGGDSPGGVVTVESANGNRAPWLAPRGLEAPAASGRDTEEGIGCGTGTVGGAGWLREFGASSPVCALLLACGAVALGISAQIDSDCPGWVEPWGPLAQSALLPAGAASLSHGPLTVRT